MWYCKPGIIGRDKLDVRWESGIWPGIRDESGEIIIGTEKEILKARSFRRKPMSERRDKRALSNMKGLPWEPIPGYGQREIKSSVYVRMPSEPICKMPNARPEVIPARRAQITKDDIEQVGLTPGCPGCTSTLRGGVRRERTEECRKRIEDALTAAGNDKVVKAQNRIL